MSSQHHSTQHNHYCHHKPCSYELEYTVIKPLPDSSAGITFHQLLAGKGQHSQQQLYVKALDHDGLFWRRTTLQPGTRVLRVNGIDAQQLHPIEVSRIMREAERELTLVVAPAPLPTTTMTKRRQRHNHSKQGSANTATRSKSTLKRIFTFAKAA